MLVFDYNLLYSLLAAERIVGIRSLHEFNAMLNGTIICRSVSTSVDSKSFVFKLNSNFYPSISRVLDLQDFQSGTFLIIEQDDVLHLAQTNAADLKMFQITISIFSPSLPAKKFSTSKSAPITIPTTYVTGHLTHPPTKTNTNPIVLSDEQFASIQDICDEF